MTTESVWCMNTIFITQPDFPQVGLTMKLAGASVRAIFDKACYPCFLDCLWHGERKPEDESKWAEWRIQNYGTLGCDSTKISMAIVGFMLRLDFRTVATPPLELYKNMVKGGALLVEGVALYEGNPIMTQITTEKGRLIHYQIDRRNYPAGDSGQSPVHPLLPN